MLFWIEFIAFWTVGYVLAYGVLRPEILFRSRPSYDPWWMDYGLPRWTEESTEHATQHYKAYVPVGIAIWVMLFLVAVEVKNHFG